MVKCGKIIVLHVWHELKNNLVPSSTKQQCEIGLLQLAITWYKMLHAGGQAHYYSRTGTLKQRNLNQ